MFRAIREAADALQGLVSVALKTHALLEEWPTTATVEPPDLSAITDRLDKIEVGYSKWEALAEANLLKADALFKNARNSEERTRAAVKKSSEALESSVEGEAEIREAYARLYGLPEGDAEGGENGEVYGVRENLALDSHVRRSMDARQARLMAKYK